jgi:hypothetical protein
VKKAVVIYWTNTGNTRKVALSIQNGLLQGGMDTTLLSVDEAKEIDYFDYDLVCFGVPSYAWQVPKPADNLLKGKHAQYEKQGKIKLSSPKVSGKNALIFCTYSGPHTGIAEAIPVGKYIGQYFDHIGFRVLDEWYVLGEFHGNEANSTIGRLGDIRGLPSQEELDKIQEDARIMASKI